MERRPTTVFTEGAVAFTMDGAVIGERHSAGMTITDEGIVVPSGNRGGQASSLGKSPEAFDALARELRANRGRLALIAGSTTTIRRLVDRLSPWVAETVSLGERVALMDQPPTVTDLLHGLTATSTLLIDIEALFHPALQVEPMAQLRRNSQSTALFVVWPGQIARGRLSYSLPGRADHVDELARDLVILRPIAAAFPDEIPYTLERYPE